MPETRQSADYPGRQFQVGQVLPSGHVPAEYRVGLCVHRGQNLRVTVEQVHGPRHRRGRSLASGEEEDGDLVRQLLVGQCPALLVAGREEPRHQVIARGSGAPVTLDEVCDLAAPARDGRGISPVAGRRQPARRGERRASKYAPEEHVERFA